MQTDQRRGTTTVDLDLDKVRPEALLRVQRLARELRLTDQLLSFDLDTVAVVSSGPAPAWTTLEGDKVSFAYNQMPAPHDRLNVAVWLGTNAHELGHVLFSPRKGSTLMYRVIESDRTFLPGIAMLHNIVEDQRQERLVLARFAPWTGYLTAALGHHLHVDDDAWLLMAGRTWLPQATRDAALAAMVAKHGQHTADAVTRVIGDYQRLTDPGDVEADEAWELLQELHALFVDQMPSIPTGCTVMTGGEPDVSEPGEGAPATADEADDDAEASGSETGDDTAQGDDTDEGKGDSDSDSDSDKQGEQSSDSNAAGSEPGKPQPLTKQDVRKQLRAHAAKQIEQNESADDELSSVLDALDSGRGGDEASGADAVGQYQDATDAAHTLHHDVGDALMDLKDESEPGWLKRTDGGRLNVRRMLAPDTDADEMFDRYEPGMMDASEMEVVLLLDVSGSMAGSLVQLAEATWAIRHAVDDLEGRCTVFTYDSGPHRVLADANERPDGRMFVPQALGGTEPSSALTEAFRLIAGSQATNRLVIILTDGGWYGGSADRVIAAMNAHHVTTVCALLGLSEYVRENADFHGCTFGAVIDEPAELARLFRRVAADRIRSNW